MGTGVMDAAAKRPSPLAVRPHPPCPGPTGATPRTGPVAKMPALPEGGLRPQSSLSCEDTPSLRWEGSPASGPRLPAGCARPSGRPRPARAARPRSGPRAPWPAGGWRSPAATASGSHAGPRGARVRGRSTCNRAAPAGGGGSGSHRGDQGHTGSRSHGVVRVTWWVSGSWGDQGHTGELKSHGGIKVTRGDTDHTGGLGSYGGWDHMRVKVTQGGRGHRELRSHRGAGSHGGLGSHGGSGSHGGMGSQGEVGSHGGRQATQGMGCDSPTPWVPPVHRWPPALLAARPDRCR